MPAPPIMDLGSGIDVQGTIRKLMEVERTPLRRLERENLSHQAEMKAWEKLLTHTKKLADNSRDLQSTINPFTSRLLVSEQPAAISGSVINGSAIIQKKIQVEQLASFHELHSKPMAFDEPLPKGNFSVKVNDKDQKIMFPGGTWQQFKDLLAESLADVVDVNSSDASATTKQIILLSRISGKQGEMQFKDPVGLLIKAGILEKKRKQSSISFNLNRLSNHNGKLNYKVNDNGKKLQLSRGSVRLDLQKPHLVNKDDFLRLQIKAQRAPLENDLSTITETQKIEVGPKISVQVGDVTLSGKQIARMREVPIGGSWDDIPRLTTRLSILYKHKDKKKTISFLRILKEGSKRNLSFLLTKKLPLGATIQGLRFYTNGMMEVVEPYFDETERLQAVHVEKPAQDAILYVNKVRIQSPQNKNIKNVLPGTSLQIKQTTTSPVSVKIRADNDKIIEKLKEWVEDYNTLLGYLRLNMRTTNETEIPPPNSGNQARSKDRGGYFATDSTARQLVAQLHTVVATVYPNSTKSFRVLAEIGISTGRIGAQWEDIRGGKLEVDETKLRNAVEERVNQVQNLFRFDADKDLRIENGVAYKMSYILKPYIQSSTGLLSSRINLIKDKISTNKDDIYRRELVLERRKQSLREQFGRMERAVKRNRALGEHLKSSTKKQE